jgi:hypothetical protein
MRITIFKERCTRLSLVDPDNSTDKVAEASKLLPVITTALLTRVNVHDETAQLSTHVRAPRHAEAALMLSTTAESKP